jgi:hypothetical protein
MMARARQHMVLWFRRFISYYQAIEKLQTDPWNVCFRRPYGTENAPFLWELIFQSKERDS